MRAISVRMRLMMIGLLGYLVLLLPATFNGSPIFWPDSIAYLHGGSTALAVAAGMETKYANLEKGRSKLGTVDPQASPDAASKPSSRDGAQAQQTRPEVVQDYRVSAARSPYYAVFLAGISSVAGLQGPVYMQALLVLLTLGFLIKAASPDRPQGQALLLLFIVPLTSTGTFAAILLPDILAPLGLLSVAVLFAFWPRLGRIDKVFWYCLLVTSVLSHTTHLAMILLLLPFATLTSRGVTGQSTMKPTALTVAALVLGILGGTFFVQLVERHYGYKPQSFPMVAASIIVDGPGRDYLEATCPGNGYVYCNYLDTQATEVDQYLWSSNPGLGVYAQVNRETKDRMSAEQWSFLIDTLRYDFSGQFQASLKRMFRQVTDNSLGQFFYGEGMKSQLRALPSSDRISIEQSALFNGRFPLSLISGISQGIGWIALAGLLLMLARTWRTETGRETAADTVTHKALIVLTMLVVVGFFINAGLTGAASQPQGRYSARIFLLFPIVLSLWVSFELRQLKTRTRFQSTAI